MAGNFKKKLASEAKLDYNYYQSNIEGIRRKS